MLDEVLGPAQLAEERGGDGPEAMPDELMVSIAQGAQRLVNGRIGHAVLWVAQRRKQKCRVAGQRMQLAQNCQGLRGQWNQVWRALLRERSGQAPAVALPIDVFSARRARFPRPDEEQRRELQRDHGRPADHIDYVVRRIGVA